jgi:hypothetical protein
VTRPATLAELALRRHDGEDFGSLVSEFLDTFYGLLERDIAAAQSAIAGEPRALADANEHALLGAIGEHLARRWSLTIPGWSNHPSRFLKEPHFTTGIDGFRAMMLAHSPLAFRRRLIFTEAEPLRRARTPRGLLPHQRAPS